MAPGVSVRSTSALADVRSGLIGYRARTQVHLRDAERELRRILDRLADLEFRGKASVRRWTDTVEDLEREYASCDEDCDDILYELRGARRQLDDAATRLASVHRHQARIDEAGRAFLVQQRRLLAHMERETLEAAALLERLQGDVEAYARVTSTGTPPAATGHVAALTLDPNRAADAALAEAGHRSARQSDEQAHDRHDALATEQKLAEFRASVQSGATQEARAIVGTPNTDPAANLPKVSDDTMMFVSFIAALVIGVQSHREQRRPAEAERTKGLRTDLDPALVINALSKAFEGLRRSFERQHSTEEAST